MDKTKLLGYAHGFKKSISKHSPEILTGLGIAGMFSAIFLTSKATVKAVAVVNEMEHIDRETFEVVKPTKKEIVKECWEFYIPAAVSATFGTACLIGSTSVNAKRNAALAAAYKLSETALTEYREAIVETVGEEKHKKIREKVAEKQVEKNPPTTQNMVVSRDNADILCYEPITTGYFWSTQNKLDAAVNRINENILSGPFPDEVVTLNEFFVEIGLHDSSIGDDLGWSLEKGVLKLEYRSMIAPDDTPYAGQPCLVLEYVNPPKYDC